MKTYFFLFHVFKMNTFSSFYSTPNPLDSITFASLVHHHKMTPQQALVRLYGTKTSQTTTKKTDKATKKREEADKATKKSEEAAIKREEKKERKRSAAVAAVAAEIQKKLRKSVPGNIMNIRELNPTTRPSTEVPLTGLQKKMWEESKKHEPKKYKTLPCEHLSGIRSPPCKYKQNPYRCPFYHNEEQKRIMKDILKKISKSTKTTKPKDSSTA